MYLEGTGYMKIIFWGGGDTAREKIYKIKKLSACIEIIAFVDGFIEFSEKDIRWEGFRLISPQMIRRYHIDYLCILSKWEWEIRKRIYDEKLFDLNRIVSFFEICLMDSFGENIKICYKNLLQNIHPQQIDYAKRWAVYEYLKKNYSYILLDEKYQNLSLDKKIGIEEHKSPIWILWLQGFKAAPEVVKICVRSIKKRLAGEQLYLLDQYNVFDYIDVPYYIVDKWKKGVISYTHFSDFVRVRILNIYGGIWIDATVYFTGNGLPYYLKAGKLFMFSRWLDWRNCPEPRITANWLICAPPANKILIVLEAFLREYWKKEDRIIDYYFFHIFLTMIIMCFPNEWEGVEKVLRDPAQLLNDEMMLPFNADRFRFIKQNSDFHKLSNKSLYINSGENSFWNEICEMENSEGEYERF